MAIIVISQTEVHRGETGLIARLNNQQKLWAVEMWGLKQAPEEKTYARIDAIQEPEKEFVIDQGIPLIGVFLLSWIR